VLRRDRERGQRFDLGYRGLQGEIGEQDAFLIHPTETLSWDDLNALSDGASPLRKTLDGLDPRGQYAYFFVYDEPARGGGASGFATFRALRSYLKGRGIQTGWRPADAEHPPLFCFWDNLGICSQYAPVYSADTAGRGD